MREIGKTKAASFLVALGCCGIASIAFQLHCAGAEERAAARPDAPIRIEKTEPRSDSAAAESPTAGAAVVLTCRLDQVKLTAGVQRDR